MNRSRWTLLLTAIALAAVSQWLLHYQEVTVARFIDRPDGSGAAVLHVRPSASRKVIAWESQFVQSRTIYSGLRRGIETAVSLASDSDGQRIVLLERGELICIDAASGQVHWKSGQKAGRFTARPIHFINDDQHVVASTEGLKSDNTTLVILNAATGHLVADGQFNNIFRYLARKDRLAVQFGREDDRFSQWCILDLSDDKATVDQWGDFLPAEFVPASNPIDVDVSMRVTYSERADDTPRLYTPHSATVRVGGAKGLGPPRLESTDKDNPASLRLQLLGFGESVLLLIVVAIATATWGIFLTSNGPPKHFRYRLLLNTAVMVSLVALMCVPVIDSATPTKPWFTYRCLPALLSATVLVAVLLSLVYYRRKAYLWGAFFVACAFPLLMPPIAMTLAVILLGDRFDKTPNPHDETANLDQPDSGDVPENSSAKPIQRQGKKYRFGIGGTMLVTTGIALFISVGHFGVFLIPGGFLILGLLMISVALVRNSTSGSLASTTFFVSTFLVVMFAAGQTLWGSGSTGVFACTIPMVIALAAMHGYRLQRRPAISEPTASVTPLQ